MSLIIEKEVTSDPRTRISASLVSWRQNFTSFFFPDTEVWFRDKAAKIYYVHADNKGCGVEPRYQLYSGEYASMGEVSLA